MLNPNYTLASLKCVFVQNDIKTLLSFCHFVTRYAMRRSKLCFKRVKAME